jgi:hypothetical protein
MTEAFNKWCMENGLTDKKYVEAVLVAFIGTINKKADQLEEIASSDDDWLSSPYHDALFGLIAEFFSDPIFSASPTTTSPLQQPR